MFNRIYELCGECKKPYKDFYKDGMGIPFYYIGNGDGTYSVGSPMKPNKADKYFCGPECASKFIRRECS